MICNLKKDKSESELKEFNDDLNGFGLMGSSGKIAVFDKGTAIFIYSNKR